MSLPWYSQEWNKQNNSDRENEFKRKLLINFNWWPKLRAQVAIDVAGINYPNLGWAQRLNGHPITVIDSPDQTAFSIRNEAGKPGLVINVRRTGENSLQIRQDYWNNHEKPDVTTFDLSVEVGGEHRSEIFLGSRERGWHRIPDGAAQFILMPTLKVLGNASPS